MPRLLFFDSWYSRARLVRAGPFILRTSKRSAAVKPEKKINKVGKDRIFLCSSPRRLISSFLPVSLHEVACLIATCSWREYHSYLSILQQKKTLRERAGLTFVPFESSYTFLLLFFSIVKIT